MIRNYCLLVFALPLLAFGSASSAWGQDADLSVATTVDDGFPAEGATIVTTIALTNDGPAQATNIQVDALVPAGLTFVSGDPTDGIHVAATGVWVLGSLDAGATATLDVTTTVDAGTAGSTITYTAGVAFAEPTDPNGANDAASVDIQVAPTAPYDVPGIGSVSVGRTKAVIIVGAAESGAPAGFTIEWMKYAEFLANGSQWPAAQDPRLADADFHGEPTLNTWGGTLTTFAIEPWQTAVVEIGDLFDETGVDTEATAELDMATSYVFRVRANGDGAAGPSAFSPPTVMTTALNMNCTYSQGYWKNHESAWPATGLSLGAQPYDKAQLLAILQQPARGNGLVILAHQLIAVELNIAQGAIYFDVEDARNEAHALIGSMIVPPIGNGSLHPRDASSIAQVLDDFNNGVIGPGHCSVSVEPQSWGKIKADYR